VGCIPTKTLLNSAKLYLHAKEGAPFGVVAENVRCDWAAMQAWKKQVVEKLRAGVAATEAKHGVEVLSAHGELLGPGRVRAGGEVREASAIVLATGSSPVMPPIPGVKGNTQAVDSTGLIDAPEVPKRLCVIGGGVIGVELAGLFAALGSKVDVVELMDEIVPFMDRDQAALLRRAMRSVGFRLGCRVQRVEGGTVHYTDQAGAAAAVEADLVLVAVGRRPNVEGWGAREAGLDVGPKGVVVDDRLRTNLPNVWAVGDVTGRSLLAHSAYRMAEVAVADLLARDAPAPRGARPRPPDRMRYDAIPWVVYGMPEAAGVGLTEVEAKARGLAVQKANVPLRALGRFAAENGFSAPGALKVVAARPEDGGRILGVHLVGAYASELIWGAAALVEGELRVEDVRQIVFPHPTVCEAIREAAWDLA
jgi:dihydrolipoamide dehydrogenase